MSDRTVTISLTAKDGVTHTFQAVAKSGESMADALKRAGQDASKGLDDLGESAKRSDADMRTLMGSAKDVGLGIGVLVGGLALSGKAFRDNQIAIDTMRRGYASSADEMLKFADAQQAATNFSNDAVVAAENVSRTLAANYGFSDSQIQQLIARTEDLAAAQGKDLGYAIQATSSAMRGEAEMAEQLGLTLNDHALGIDKLSASTSEAEKAGVRFNAFLEQSSYAQGVAQEQAHGTYGMLVELGHGFQDAGQDIGDFLGPFGEIGAYAADNVIKLGALSVSVGQLAKGAMGAKDLIGAGGLAGTAGIAGLGIAAGAVAVGGLAILMGTLQDDLPHASQESIDSMQDLIDKIVEAGDTSEFALMLTTLNDVMTTNKEAVDRYTDSYTQLMLAQEDLRTLESLPIDDEVFQGMSDQTLNLIDTNHDLRISYDEISVAVDTWKTTAESAEQVNDGLAAGFDELQEIWRETGDAGRFAQSEALAYTKALLAGEITPQRYEQLLQALVVGYKNTGEAALAASASVMDFNGALGGVALTGKRTAGDLMLFFDEIAHGITAVDENRIAWEKWKKELDSNHYVAQLQHDSLDGVSRGLDAVTVAIKTAQGALNNLEFTPLRDFGAEFKIDFGEPIDFDLGPVRDRIIDALGDIATAPEALDNAYRVIVSNTNAIGQNAQQVQDWADELIGAQGEYAKIDDLLQQGTISMDEYTAAQAAYTPIAEANARIQDNILAIQTDQAPVLADLMQTTDDYIARIREMDGIQQTAALGFMDQAESAEALKLKMLALDAASGALGSQGAEWASGIIVGAAEADPVLASMLLKMGLISETIDANGHKTYTVNLDDQASGPLQTLNDSVERLAFTELLIHFGVDEEGRAQADAAFEELFGHAAEWDGTNATATIGADNTDALGKFQEAENALAEWNRSQGTAIADADNSNADAALSDAQNRLAEWDRSTGTATINANDNATDTLVHALALANAFANSGATATFTANYVVTGDMAAAHNLYANGGVIRAAAMGRVINGMTLVGEAGPELLIGGEGRMVFPATGTNQSLRGQGGPQITVNVSVAGNVVGVDDLAVEIAREMAPAWQRAVAAHVGSV